MTLRLWLADLGEVHGVGALGLPIVALILWLMGRGLHCDG
jgi:hypothetical protein